MKKREREREREGGGGGGGYLVSGREQLVGSLLEVRSLPGVDVVQHLSQHLSVNIVDLNMILNDTENATNAIPTSVPPSTFPPSKFHAW